MIAYIYISIYKYKCIYIYTYTYVYIYINIQDYRHICLIYLLIESGAVTSKYPTSTACI